MMTETLVALITGVITALVTLVVARFSTKFNYNKLYAETISKNRYDWITLWREYISEYIAICDTLRNQIRREVKNNNCDFDCSRLEQERSKYLELITKRDKLKYSILLRINPDEDEHIIVGELVKELIFDYDDEKYNFIKEKLISILQIYLKVEWERVKKESRGDE